MDFSGAKNRQEHRHRLAFTLYGHALIVLDIPWPHSLPLYALCFVFSIVLPKSLPSPVFALRLVRRDPETSLSVQSRPWPMTRQKCLRIVRAGGHLFHSVLSVFAGIVLRSMRPSWPTERVGARPHSRSPARQRTRNTGRSIVFPRLEKESVSCRQRKRRDTPLSVCDEASSHRTGNVLCKDVGVES